MHADRFSSSPGNGELVPRGHVDHEKTCGEESVYGDMDRPEEMLLEELEKELRNQLYSEDNIVLIRAAWHAIERRNGFQATMTAFIDQSENKIRGEAVRKVLAIIISTDDARLTAETMAMAAGIHLGNDDPQIAIARRYGITRQAVSKRMTSLCQELGLQPSGYMRSARARDSYRERENKKILTIREKIKCLKQSN